MVEDNRLKYRALLMVMVVLVTLSSFYLVLIISNQNNHKNWEIEANIKTAEQEIRNLVEHKTKLYHEKIKYLVANHEVICNFQQKDSSGVVKSIHPYFSILEKEDPFFFMLNLYSPDNTLFASLNDSANSLRDSTTSLLVSGTNFTLKSYSGFEFDNENLYYKIVEPVFFEQNFVGVIEFGLRENELLSNLSKKHNLKITGIFNKNKLSENLFQKIANNQSLGNYILHSHLDNTFFKKVLPKFDNQYNFKVKYYDKYYHLYKIKISGPFPEKGLEYLLIALDISKEQKAFLAYLFKAIGITILFLLTTFLIFLYSFNPLLTRIFDLRKSLDLKVAALTKNIIDSNTELNQIFNSTSNAIRLIDKNYNILRVNRTFEEISGFKSNEIEGKKCFDIFPSPYCHTADCALYRIINGESKIEIDIEKVNKFGLKIPGIQTSVPFKGQKGELIGIIQDFKDIAKRKEIEEALKKSEKQFSLFMDYLPVGVYIKDESSRIIYANKYMQNVFGKGSYLKGQSPSDIFQGGIAKKVLEEDIKVLSQGFQEIEELVDDSQGSEKTFMTHKFKIKNTENSFQIGGISVDITKRKKAEHQINLLSSAIKQSPVIIMITNPKGEIEFINPIFTKVTGFSMEEIMGKTPNILKSGKHSEFFYDNLWATISSGNDWQGEFLNKKKNKELFWAYASISPVKNNNGEITHYIAVMEDITNRKEVENSLAREKDLLQTFMDNIPDNIYFKDTDCKFIRINIAEAKTLGIDNPAKAIGKTDFDFFEQNIAKISFNDEQILLKTGKSIINKVEKLNLNNEDKWFSVSKVPVKNEKGEITGIVGISRDITQIEMAKRKLEEAKEKAEEADSLKTAFLTNMSHEIRTPMNAIIGFSNLLSNERLTSEERRKLNTLISDNNAVLLKLIDDIIDISKIEAGQIIIKKSPCFINKILQEIFESFNQKLIQDESKNNLKLFLKQDHFKNGILINTDAYRVRQVLTNLIGNALKFTESGFVEFGYAIKENNNMLFYVIDTGSGIALKKQKQIFERFRQADDSHTRSYGGTGLGLAISKSIVNLLGGEIWVQSTPKLGSTFFFTIPLEKVELKFESKEPDAQKLLEFDWKDKVILVADDIDVNYSLIQTALNKTKAQILWAKDGKEALDFCKTGKKIDLILMDINMPVMNGYDATKEIKKLNKNLPIIGQTAYAMSDEEEKCMSAGFDQYITKPIQFNRLMILINKYFGIN